MQYILPISISYVLGSIIFSFVIGKWVLGVDVRQHGSGNAGATNTHRVLGLGPAVLVLVLDMGKGIAAIWIGQSMAADQPWIPVLCGISVIVGHNWPIFLRFRGGKGIATTIGVVMTLCFLPALYAALVAVLCIALTRYVSLGSLVFTAMLPIILWLMDRPSEIWWASLFIMALAYIRHRKNISNLLRGTENKLGSKPTNIEASQGGIHK